MRRLGIVATALALLVAASPVARAQEAAEVPANPWLERRVLNVAHAGGDLEAPHSTLYAMRTAVAEGADVLEMDVRLSSDGVLMVQHDDTVDRTTEATGLVSSYTAAELQALDNAYWFVPGCWSCHDRPAAEYGLRGVRTGAVAPPAGSTPDDFAIPTLEQVVEAFPDRLLDVEIKDGPLGMAGAEALAEFIAAHGPADRFLVASFDDDILAHFRSLAPDVATSPGVGELTAWFVGSRGPLPGSAVLQVPPVFSGIPVVSQQFVDDAHAAGLAVWVWFNGDEDDSPVVWQQLLDMGVDALLTGKPRQAEAVLDANEATFTAAPSFADTGSRRGSEVTVEVDCPEVHVDRCRGLVGIRTVLPGGLVRVLALAELDQARGTVDDVTLTVLPAVLGWRRPLELVLAPVGGDTAVAIEPIDVARRFPAG